MAPAKAKTGAQLGYARVSTGHQSLDQQLDALHAAEVDPERVYHDKLSARRHASSGPAWPRYSTTPGPVTRSWSSV